MNIIFIIILFQQYTWPDQREQSLEQMISKKLTPDISTSSDEKFTGEEYTRKKQRNTPNQEQSISDEEKKELVSEISLTKCNYC